MKYVIPLIISLFLITLLSCKKECSKSQSVTVVKDCTGTYLRVDGKDYQVCNLEKVSSFSDGATVNASFTKINECDGSAKDAIVCMMFHQNEGWIQVEKIQ